MPGQPGGYPQQGGYPQPGGYPPQGGFQQGGYPQPGYPQQKKKGKGGLIAILCGAGAVVVIAAVVIVVVLKSGTTYKASLPFIVNGWSKDVASGGQYNSTSTQQMNTIGGGKITQSASALYEDPVDKAKIIISIGNGSGVDPNTIYSTVQSKAAANNATVTSVSPGPHGGTAWCEQISQSGITAVTCGWATSTTIGFYESLPSVDGGGASLSETTMEAMMTGVRKSVETAS
jgi:hypothetical protein